MSIRSEIERKIQKKLDEIKGLKDSIAAAQLRIEGLREALDGVPLEAGATPFELRPDSGMAKVRTILRQAGKPMHIAEIQQQMGGKWIMDKPFTRGTTNGLAGSLSTYAKKGKVFTKTAHKTFGLIEFNLTRT